LTIGFKKTRAVQREKRHNIFEKRLNDKKSQILQNSKEKGPNNKKQKRGIIQKIR
jgi:hypothetical protein